MQTALMRSNSLTNTYSLYVLTWNNFCNFPPKILVTLLLKFL